MEDNQDSKEEPINKSNEESSPVVDNDQQTPKEEVPPAESPVQQKAECITESEKTVTQENQVLAEEEAPVENEKGSEASSEEKEDSTKEDSTKEETPSKEEVKEVIFDDLKLSPQVLSAVKASGYEKPTQIQRDAIPVILEGRDVIGASQTGTGKTAAFALPSLTRIKPIGKPQIVVLEPTRELAHQVAEQFKNMVKRQGVKLHSSMVE